MANVYPEEPHSSNNKVKLINEEFKNKYRIDEELVYDFDSNKYSSTSRVQDLIRKYNSKISSSGRDMYRSSTKYNSLLNINEGMNSSMYSNGTVKGTKFSNSSLYDNMSFQNSLASNTVDGNISNSPIYNSSYSQSPYSIGSTNLNSPSKVHNLNPINVIYTPRQVVHQEPVQKVEQVQHTATQLRLYGPSVELTFPIKFTILNTIYSFDQTTENTIYYFKVTSNINWIIVKTLKQIKELLKGHDLSYNCGPMDKQIRDDIIVSILNNIYKQAPSFCDSSNDEKSLNGSFSSVSFISSNYKSETNINERSNSTTGYSLDSLQYFILTNITKEINYKGQFLLIDAKPYLCKLVGKALVSYNADNRVHKLFLLDECKIEMDLNKSYSFILIHRKSVFELTASCKRERDEWIREISEYMNKR